MMKKYIATTALLALVFAGFALADHVTTTEQHVVVFDPPPITSTIIDTDNLPHETTTVRETVTVTAPTTTQPPTTTTEPPPSPGTTINVTNVPWRCTQPLSSYATNGLPLHINHRTTASASLNWPVNGAIRLETGCRGDSNTNTIDLTFDIDGNGADIGPAGDSFVIAGATDIQIGPSRADCGLGGAQGGHEDAFRANRGHRITMFGFESGNWANLDPTCHGAGGNAYFDNVNQDRAGTTSIVCIDCKVVASAYAPTPGTQGDFGVGAGFGWSTDSGAIHGCWAAVRPKWHYMSGSTPLALRAVDVDNFTIQFAVGTNTPLSGQPPASACPLED